MQTVAPEVWFPVITLIIGAVLNRAFDMFAARRAFRQQAQEREENRRESLKSKRLEFQHTTLLEFQEVLSRLVRFIGRAQHHDELNHRATGKWRDSLLPEDVDEGILKEQTAFSRLKVRILDDQTRNLASELSDMATAVVLSRSLEEGRASMMATADVLIKLNERIGILLRELDLNEET